MTQAQSLLEQLRRRKVLRAGVLYGAAAFAVLEFADIAFPRMGLPDRAVDLVLWAGLLGLPVVLALAWRFDLRSEPASEGGPGWLSAPALATAAVLVGLGLGAGWWAGGGGVEDELPTLTILPLTNTAGLSLSGSWSPDGSQLAYDYTLNGSMDVAVVSLGGGEPRMVAGGPNDEAMPRWSPDGSKIAFVSDDGTGLSVYWVPPSGGTRRLVAKTHLQYLDSFSTLSAIGSQPWSPDGRMLVFSRAQSTGVALWTIDVVTGEETRLTSPTPGTLDFRAAWSHDGEWIAFTRVPPGVPSFGLYLVPAAGGEPRPLLVDENLNGSPNWTLDDRRILFTTSKTRTGGGDIWDLDVDTGERRPLTTGAGASSPILSSTGRIAYSRWGHETSFFRLVVGSAEDHQQISHSTGNNFSQRFSPDGKQIVFQSSRSGRAQLWLHDLVTGAEHPLGQPPEGKEDRTPDWSPDGSEIVFLSNRGGPFQLWVIHAEGGVPRRISEQAIPMDGDWWVQARVAPRWSSDGRVIAYLAPGDRGTTLWLIDPDGNNARQTAVSGVLRFDWYLDSRRVVYTRNTLDGSGHIEMLATDLETGAEVVLLEANATELSVAPDGRSVAYNSADGHFSMNRYLLQLEKPLGVDELPVAIGEPEQITFGKGIWHVHGGAWTPDSKQIVYTKDFDSGNLFVINGYH